jgi:NAD(P)-dependent dehydrogenase (short-subunit alcohol dehydrogenase family)
LTKTLAQEWPEVRIKVVDLDARESVATQGSQIIQELATTDGPVEVGYAGGRRLALQVRPAPLSQDDGTSSAIDSSSVLLITGGARGITAEMALHLAERYRPTLLLVGRSPVPDPEEAADTAGLETPQQLKAALIQRMRGVGRQPVPAEVELEYTRLQREREIRSNLAAMKGAGASVHYFSADVRDEAAFGGLIEQIYETFGRIDGVIHGAGAIEDKLVKDKSPESFDRVLDSKADGAFILSRKLRPDSLRFLVFFSSAAARFGNRGQGDYAAANEVMNKLAGYLDSRWPGRVVSVNWGPWRRMGMVSPELEKEFARRGIGLISALSGCESMDRELRYGRKGDVEVLLTNGGWETPGETQPPPQKRALPMLDQATPSWGTDGSLEVIRTLDPSRDPYLLDHQLNGKPVLPMAVATELMAELASLACPELELVAVRDLKVLRGIVLENGPQAIRIVAKPRSSTSGVSKEMEVTVTGTEDSQKLHYRAVAELAPGLSPASVQIPSPSEEGPFPLSVEGAYQQWLFQGPLLQGLTAVRGVGSDGIAGSLSASSPETLMAGDANGSWLIDPVIIDSGLQLVILWTRMHWDETPLPSGFRAYRRFGPLSGPEIDCRIRIRGDSGSHIIHTDLFFVGSDGHVLGVLEDMEFACSKSVNRRP